MLVALHLVFGQSHDCGIRSIGWFLEPSKLDAFIASSFGSQQKVASQVEPVSNFLILEAYELGKATSLALNRQEQQAQQAAGVFQRSSSCVEGRNGQLSLRHHGLRELTTSKLKALRTIHNYVIEREDGTTAAERFFAIKPRDLFGWLLEQLPMPSRPRKSRNQPDLI